MLVDAKENRSLHQLSPSNSNTFFPSRLLNTLEEALSGCGIIPNTFFCLLLIPAIFLIAPVRVIDRCDVSIGIAIPEYYLPVCFEFV